MRLDNVKLNLYLIMEQNKLPLSLINTIELGDDLSEFLSEKPDTRLKLVATHSDDLSNMTELGEVQIVKGKIVITKVYKD